MRIGIILGSTREGRIGDKIAGWLDQVAQKREGEATYELVDLLDYNLPVFSGPVPPMALNKEYADDAVKAWSDKIDSFDGFLFVTAEYNYSVPAPFKNAFDMLASEWRGKAIAFAGYGFGGGVESVRTWQSVVNVFEMKKVEQTLSFSLKNEITTEGEFSPAAGQEDNVNAVLDRLEELAG